MANQVTRASARQATAAPSNSGASPQTPAPANANKPRKFSSRERLLKAATTCFSNDGFAQVSVEDIASTAGVSRMTLYRHFGGKSEIASELLRQGFTRHQPNLLRIRDVDWRDHAAVHHWISELFETDQENRLLLRAFVQASSVDQDFTRLAHNHIAALIKAFGESIPAFDLRADHPNDRRRWLEAWLLVYEILDQSNHAALESGIASDPLTLDIITDRFLAFVSA
jgi:AcrR family transcriptional regulator